MAFNNKHCLMQMSLCLLFMLSVTAGLCAEGKPDSSIPFKIIKGEVKKSADGSELSWDNYLEIEGLAGNITLCPSHLYKIADAEEASGFDPSSLKLQYLDETKKMILIQCHTHSVGSGRWIVSGRIILQLNEKRTGFTELYRNFFMSWVRAGWSGGSYCNEEIFYDDGSGFITISRSSLDVLGSKDKILMSNYFANDSGGTYLQRITKTTTFTCQIKDGKLIPLSSVSFINCDAKKYTAAKFTQFCHERKITPLDKGSTTFPIVTEFARPGSIPVETYEQASYIAS